MKVLIVVPRYVAQPGEFYQFPLGLAYIAAAVESAGHGIVGLNLNQRAGDVDQLVAEAIEKHQPDICATGGLSPFLPCIAEIFSAARRAKPGILNVAGGGVVSSDAEVAPEIMDIDVGVVGEGEATIVELLSVLSAGDTLADVKGIVFWDEAGTVRVNPARPAVMDLSEIPRANYEVLGFGEQLHLQNPLDHYFLQAAPDNRPRAIDIITSRSCPYSCTFCFHPVGKVYRERPLDDVFEELEELIERFDINLVGIIDELFSLRKARLLEFCERIKPLGVLWMVQLHVNSADEITLKALRESGCVSISYGIESMSPSVLISMMKKSKKERIEVSLAQTQQEQIGIQGNLIFGDTAETLETANESMKWWAENRHFPINLTRLQVFPGSPDYIAAVRDELIIDRVNYAIELPVFLNISGISDGNMDLMTALLWAQGRALLKLGILHRFEESRYHEERGASSYDIDWTCPSCGAENEYRECIIPPENPHALRLHCRSCCDRWDVENRAREATHNAEISGILQNVRDLMEQAKLQDARVELGKLIEKYPDAAEIYAMKAKLSRLREDVETELRSCIFAVGHAPFIAGYHCDLAEVLLKLNVAGAARLHLEQALALDPALARAELALGLLLDRDPSDPTLNSFFPDMFEGPGAVRPLRDTPSYDRKREPAFPVFKRTANRQSVAVKERQPQKV